MRSSKPDFFVKISACKYKQKAESQNLTIHAFVIDILFSLNSYFTLRYFVSIFVYLLMGDTSFTHCSIPSKPV